MKLKDISFEFLNGKWHTKDLHFLVIWPGGVRLYKHKVVIVKTPYPENKVAISKMPVLEKEYELKDPVFRYDPNNNKYWITENVSIVDIDEDGHLTIEYDNNLLITSFKKE